MLPLDKTQRNQLERTIKEAREVAEGAARVALEHLGVGEDAPFSYLSEQERQLRRRLRAHGRQLGDIRNNKPESQEIRRLIEEVAYQHWHRMLFSRYLAENNLLMYPDPVEPVPVTLEECEELAADEGAADGWELASRFAARMLPQIFRFESPVFQLILPPEYQYKLERLVAHLPLEVFTASDSLGWVYQYWQAKKKDEVNDSEVKIGAMELPAVTQLFTEPYMVSFLLDNSVGAWWAARRLSDTDLRNAVCEEELRKKASIPGVSLEYLRFIRREDGTWTPAAGTYDGWPEKLSDLKTLDPCCGSGHFLVAAFLMLVPMRMEMERLSAKEAVDAVLRENIHGLEIDQRCVELAAFALAFSAWKYPCAGGFRILPEINVACSGLSINAKKEEWLALAGDNINLKIALDILYNQFKDAPVLGSLINPKTSLGKDSLLELQWEDVRPLLIRALAGEHNDEIVEMGIIAKGIARAATILSDHFYLVMTNVPYLTRSKFSDSLRRYTEKYHMKTNADLATAMIDRFYWLIKTNGVISVVSPQNWLFQPAYKEFREAILNQYSWRQIVQLGFGSFNTPLNAAPSLFIAIKGQSINSTICKCDVASGLDIKTKREMIVKGLISFFNQNYALQNKDFLLDRLGNTNIPNLSESIDVFQGIRTGDKQRFTMFFWEIDLSPTWEFLQSTCRSSKHWDGLSECIRWEKGIGQLHEYAEETRDKLHDMHESGNLSWGKRGITICQMGNLESSLYSGARYDGNCATITPKDDGLLTAIYTFCSSKEYQVGIREIDQSIKVTNATLGKIPFDVQKWKDESITLYPDGLPRPYTDDPTQWVFHGHPFGSVVWDKDTKHTAKGLMRGDNTVLQIAVAHLLGYRWPAELDERMELAAEQREWVERCDALLPYSDNDGIVCIPPLRGESSAADQLLDLLAAAYGDSWANDTLTVLLKNSDHAGKTLETWLRDKFFTQHCKLFQHRPFIWHIWDGLRDGFAVLVNYHKLDAKLLETLIYTYLGDWISRQKQDIAVGKDGAYERLDAAEALKRKLELILIGEAPYDVFVRWKSLEKQPIGWEPDLNDGVRLNIRPFLTVPDVGKKGAGILRDRPNINWDGDRGKDVESAPWYRVFGGERINNHHLTLAVKRAAREAKK
jgi:hypothetical protein